MSNQGDRLEKLEARKKNLLEILEHEEEVLNSMYNTLFERISRLQVEESILMAYLEGSKGNQTPFDAYALSTFGYHGGLGYGENNYEDLNDEEIDWNNYTQDDMVSQGEDLDSHAIVDATATDESDQADSCDKASDQEALNALLEQYGQGGR